MLYGLTFFMGAFVGMGSLLTIILWFEEKVTPKPIHKAEWPPEQL